MSKQKTKLQTEKTRTLKKSQGGFMSVDFLFSMVISALVCMMLFAMSTTYTVIEIAQYIAFSTARAHAGGNENYSAQQQVAQRKFRNLANNPVIGPLFKNGWFELTIESIKSGQTADGSNYGDDYSQSDKVPIPQVGVRLQLNAKLLNMKVGPLGSSDAEGTGFKTNITGFLIREPTWQECWDQMKLDPRYESILRLDNRYKDIADRYKARSYLAMEDNGC